MTAFTRPEFEASIHLYVGGDLEGDDARLVEEWLAEHPEDLELVERARAARDVLVGHRTAWEDREVDLWAGVQGRMAAPAVPSPLRPVAVAPTWSGWRRHLVAAAAVLMGSGAAFVYGRGSAPSVGPDPVGSPPAVKVPLSAHLGGSELAAPPAPVDGPDAMTLAGGTGKAERSPIDRMRSAIVVQQVGLPPRTGASFAPAALGPAEAGRTGASPLRKTGGFGEHLLDEARPVPVVGLEGWSWDPTRGAGGASLTSGR